MIKKPEYEPKSGSWFHDNDVDDLLTLDELELSKKVEKLLREKVIWFKIIIEKNK